MKNEIKIFTKPYFFTTISLIKIELVLLEYIFCGGYLSI